MIIWIIFKSYTITLLRGGDKMEKVNEYNWHLKGKTRKCRKCGRKILPGEPVFVEIWIKAKFYPIKGVMKFTENHYFCVKCSK